MKTNQKSIAVRLLVLTLAAICLFAGSANALPIPIYRGTFTLPNEVRWGKAMLPPGEYSLQVDYMDSVIVVSIKTKSGKAVAFVQSANREDSGKGSSALLISTKGNQSVVHSLRLTELGMTFIYDPHLAHGRGMIEEARKTSAVPVTMAKK